MILLGDLILEVVREEAIDQSNQVTTKPVEDGADISDHIRQDPIKIDLSAVVAGDKAGNLYQQLEKMCNSQEVFDYKGEQRNEPYKSMAIERVSLSRNPAIANGHEIKIALKQVRVVTQKTTSALGIDPVTQMQATTQSIQTKVKELKNMAVDPNSKALLKWGGLTVELPYIPLDVKNIGKISDRFKINLFGKELAFDVTWNPQDGSLNASCYDSLGNPIIEGRNLIHDENFFEGIMNELLPAAKIVPLDLTGVAETIGITLENLKEEIVKLCVFEVV